MSFKKPNFFQAPNVLVDELLSTMDAAELKVLLVVMRKTIGWQKDRDRISLTQLQSLTGLSRQGVLNGIEKAEKRGVLLKTQTAKGNQFELVNSVDYQDSQLVNSVDHPSQLSRPVLVNSVDTQKKLSKETIQNKKPPLPPKIDLEAAKQRMIEGEKTPLKQLKEKHPDFYPHYEEMLKLSKVFAFSVKLAKTKAFLTQIENHSQDQLITVATKTLASIGNPTYIFQEFFKNLTATHTTAAGSEYENPYDAARARIKAKLQEEKE